ncbi:MAG TPA: hypothetical protein VJT73_00985 [Polyangiaceae bacterium]|nr:hypothetical protein [Polyangiaceae bacterium]
MTSRLAVAALSSGVFLASACSLGEGEGQIASEALKVTGCSDGRFVLSPDFFAAVPFRNTLTIRVQHGGDIEEVSDGAIILVDDVEAIRRRIAVDPGTEFRVGLQPSIVPPGYPIVADPDPPLVHLTLYLHRSCHAQNSALYAIAGAIRFQSLFNANPNETNAAEKLTQAEFADISLADPRELAGEADPAAFISHIHGYFRFYFQRGQPAQPFP